MSSMMDDINKYAAIWDTALAKGIFKDAPTKFGQKEGEPNDSEESSEESENSSDFFGQYLADDYDMDKPLNEVDTKYWKDLCHLADPNRIDESKDDNKNVADVMAKAHNPIVPTTVGKDQNVNVTQNWGVGGKELFQLEELKVRLEKLESKLSSFDPKQGSQSKIDSLKKQIDELSDSLDGERFSNDG